MQHYGWQLLVVADEDEFVDGTYSVLVGTEYNELLGKSSLESLIFAATICVVTIISNVLI